MNSTGGNDQDVQRRIELACSCMKTISHGIWNSCISASQDKMYSVCIVPVLMYGDDVWSLTVTSQTFGCIRPVVLTTHSPHPV